MKIDGIDVTIGERATFPTGDLESDAAILGEPLAADLHIRRRQPTRENGIYCVVAVGSESEKQTPERQTDGRPVYVLVTAMTARDRRERHRENRRRRAQRIKRGHR